jgi:hypothetical protein
MPIDDPSSWRFSLPTICDDLPEVMPNGAHDAELEVPEDLWRACELVSREHQQQLAQEVESVRSVVEAGSGGVGFETCHVRSGLQEPVGGKVTLPELLIALGRSREDVHSVAIRGHGSVVDGFSVAVDPTCVAYGLIRAKSQACLVIGFCDSDGVGTVPESLAVAQLASRVGLVLVDWLNPRLLGSR